MKGLFKRPDSPYWWYRCTLDGRRVRVSLKVRDRDAAIERARNIQDLSTCPKEWRVRCNGARIDTSSWLRQMVARVNGRNKKLGFDAEPITLDCLYELALASRGRCAVTKIPFRWDGRKAEIGPYGVSIDRITPRTAYKPGNLRLVLRAVNAAMHDWGEDAFWEIAEHAVKKRRARKRHVDVLKHCNLLNS